VRHVDYFSINSPALMLVVINSLALMLYMSSF
jgi:hypothetical protein